MPQNIYDDPEFFAGYTRLERQVHGHDGAPEWPVIEALLPDVTGMRIADLGCGFGWFARWARDHGAVSVLGIDLSANMLERAASMTDDPAITWQQADLGDLRLPPAAFDLVYSSLTFHYIADFPNLARTIHHALAPGGHLVFSIEHPVYMASANPRWITDEDRRTWPVDHYADEGERITSWFVDGVRKYHRRLSTTINVLIDAGFAIRRLDEFAPSPEQVASRPGLAEDRERPMMAIIAARRSS
jgi:SAM-dependent methyltransferase